MSIPESMLCEKEKSMAKLVEEMNEGHHNELTESDEQDNMITPEPPLDTASKNKRRDSEIRLDKIPNQPLVKKLRTEPTKQNIRLKTPYSDSFKAENTGSEPKHDDTDNINSDLVLKDFDFFGESSTNELKIGHSNDMEQKTPIFIVNDEDIREKDPIQNSDFKPNIIKVETEKMDRLSFELNTDTESVGDQNGPIMKERDIISVDSILNSDENKGPQGLLEIKINEIKEKLMNSSSSLDAASCEESTPAVHTCIFCNATFISPYHCVQHLMNVHGSSNLTAEDTQKLNTGLIQNEIESFDRYLENRIIEELYGSESHTDEMKGATMTESAVDKPYKCNVCDHTFKTKRDLIRHEVVHSDEKPYKCDVCGNAFKWKGDLKRHQITHTDEKPYKCDKCGNTFKRKGDLLRHEIVHTDEKPYKCDICGQAYNQIGTLTTHKRIHSGERPYICNVCGCDFMRSGDLNKHKRTHTGEQPYKCDVCGRAFNRSSNFARHKKTHSGEKPYKCDECGYAFSLLSHLQRHTLIHTGEKPYECDKCDQAFNRASALTKHMERHADDNKTVLNLPHEHTLTTFDVSQDKS